LSFPAMNNNNKEEQEHHQLTEEEDPGPGDVRVQVSGSGKISLLNKRSLAAKSAYFRSYLARFLQKGDEEKVHQLKSDFCSAEALLVLEKYVNQGVLSWSSNEEAEEVMSAANFLLMEALQVQVVEPVKKLITKDNFVNYYNKYCVTRGITHLKTFIRSTIVLPAEAARKRKFGKFDLTVKLHQLDFHCHKAPMCSTSQKMKNIIVRDPNIDTIEGAELGVNVENAQLVYNMLERVYLNEQSVQMTSVQQSLNVLKLTRSLQLFEEQSKGCLDYITRNISVSNCAQIYQAGLELGLEEMVRIALLYLAYKITDLALLPLFLSLPLQHVCQVLADSKLNVPEELFVATLAFKWMDNQNKTLSECEDLFREVRWSLISPSQTSSLLSTKPDSHHISQLAAQSRLREPRCWPQQLLLVSSAETRLTFHSYDFSSKTWSSSAGPRVGKLCGVAGLSQGSLVISQSHTGTWWTPFSVARYDLWSESWSLPPPAVTVHSQPQEGAEGEAQLESLVTGEGAVFAAVRGGESKGGRTVLCGAGQVTSPSPIYSVYGETLWPGENRADRGTAPRLVITGDTVHIIEERNVSSYKTSSHSWSQSSLQGPLVGGTWIPLSDGRLMVTGGLSQQTKQLSSQCQVYTEGLEEEPMSVASLTEPRLGHSLAEYRGHVFAAGGKTLPRRRSSTSQVGSEKRTVEYYVPLTDVWHPLPVQPDLSPASTVLALVVVDTPLRALVLSSQDRRGVKRMAGSHGNSTEKRYRSQ